MADHGRADCGQYRQHPIPSAARCYKLGRRSATPSNRIPRILKVVILGTGGMSHQLQGERAGFINTTFDHDVHGEADRGARALTRLSNAELVEQAGSEGVELIMWLAMRGAMTRGARVIHSHYHIPVSNTAPACSSSKTPRQRCSRSRRIMTGKTVLIVDDETSRAGRFASGSGINGTRC